VARHARHAFQQESVMRNNFPVTDVEIELSDTETIVSTTDLQGNITYANTYFIAISGYTEEELIGAPQNILRHPDMPVEAFADMWATIRSGRSWTGMVKNRCKNGDAYWVMANATPVMENGKAVGYMSVRTKPTRAQITAAAELYRNLKAGTAGNIRLQQGMVRATGLRGWLAAATHMTLRRRIALNLTGQCAMLLLLMGFHLLDGAVRFPHLETPLGILTGAAGVSLLYFWYALHATLLRPMEVARQACQTMAGGDLSVEFSSNRQDEMGQLTRAMHQLRVNLQSIVGDVRTNFQQISVATAEIATGNMDLSGRTEAQASALEETASSMEELASTVQQNSASVGQASTMAEAADGTAVSGGLIVGEVIATMDEISEASRKIGDIIGIIESIAFQTNILALNAAVEAARAGEEGRGFAVVASEVRNLAQRSNTSAQEIKRLIAASISKVEAGAALAVRAGETTQQVQAAVRKVSGLMNEIASASREQVAGIGQVNDAVTQMDGVTQQNAALVEQSAAAAAALQEQTLKVVQALAVFKLARSAAPAAMPATPPRRSAGVNRAAALQLALP
jgi:aerotaxis receptor